MKSILEYSRIEAQRFFLKEESYFNFDLPKYFIFQNILEKVSQKIEGKLLSDFYENYIDPNSGNQKATYPFDYENVNYKILNNKDGKFSWRPLQLIHPAFYVSLVHRITEEVNWNTIVERFRQFDKNPRIKCYSLPVESESELSDKAATVSNWWQSIEQKSIELALNYEYVLHTDISDCYGSIYTHSIVWALHTKEVGKRERNNKSLIGNIIDKHLQDMSCGQTNGIPQGSVLMDLIAEMVLGYADLELSERVTPLKLNDFKIIRYRDDYRVFTNNPQDAELILKHLTEIHIELGLRLNAQKTLASNNVVQDSIKPDKLFWILNKKRTWGLQEHLLLIHELSLKFPNSGSLSKALNKYFNRIKNLKETNHSIPALISIIVDIAFKNPRTYPIVSAILSKFLSLIDLKSTRDDILNSISIRFDKIPNTGHLQIWLQRIVLKIDRHREFEETLCKKLNDSNISIWQSDWLNNNLRTMIDDESIIDEQIIGEIDEVIEIEEVQLFDSKTNYTY